MAARNPQRESGPPTTPQRFPDTTPPYPSSDYSFTLQAVMEMQKTLGQLIQSVETLTEQGKEQGKKLDRISHIIYAAGVVLAIAIVIGGWAIKVGSDMAVGYFNVHQSTQGPSPPLK